MKKIGILIGTLVILSFTAAISYSIITKRDVTTKSDDAYSEFVLGKVAFLKIYYGEAISHFRKAIEHDPEFAMAYLYIGECIGEKNSKEAEAMFRKAAQFKNEVTEHERLLISYIEALQLKEDYEEAHNILADLHERYPKSLEAHHFMAKEFKHTGESEKAEEEYKHILKIDLNYAMAYNDLGYLSAIRGELDKAIEYLQKYVYIAPDQLNPYDSLGEIYIMAGRYEKAIQVLEKGLSLDLGKPAGKNFIVAAIFRNLANAHASKGMYAKAREYLNESNEFEQNEFRVQYNKTLIAKTYLSEGNDKLFLKTVGEIEKQNPGNTIVHQLKGSYFVSVNKLGDAWYETGQLKGISDERKRKGKYWQGANMCFKVVKAEISASEGKYDEAVKLFQETIKEKHQFSDTYEIRTKLANIFFLTGEIQNAISTLTFVLDANPNYAKARYSLANIFYELNDYIRAENEMKAYLEIMADADNGLEKVDEIKTKLNKILFVS